MNEHSEDIKNKSKKMWGVSPAGTAYNGSYEKGSKEYFDTIRKKRITEELWWLSDLVQFQKFKKKKVLEIGCGAGYDAYLFCKNGSDYTGIDIAYENKVLTEQNLFYYGYEASIFGMDVEKIDFENEFDFVYSFGVLHHVPDIDLALKNIYVSLKENGEIFITVYNKFSIFYFMVVIFSNWILHGNFLKRTLKDQLSLIEYSKDGVMPLVNVYSKREIKRIVERAGFVIENIQIRKLDRIDLRSIRFIGRFFAFMPLKLIQILSKTFGWYICIIAQKRK